jgi:hypothetical protein
MNTMDKAISERVHFQSPDTEMLHSRLIDAFVDDTSLSFTADDDENFEDLAAKLTHIATEWNKLLYYSGGSLNLQKCAYHITTWDWQHGRPRIQQTATIPVETLVSVQCLATKQFENIRYQPYSQPNRILGVHLTPSGDFSHQLALLKKKADSFADRLHSPHLSSRDITIFMKTTYGPAMGYVLPSLAVDEEELYPVQSHLLSVVLRRLGFSSKTPVALRHGPREMGGLELYDIRTEMGISQLKLMRNAIYSNTEVGKMIIMSLKYSQIEAGIIFPLLEAPGVALPYLTSTWITSVRQFLFQHNLTITLTDKLQIRLQGPNDQCIMQPPYLKKYSPQQQKDINLVRLYLQVMTLSDISESNGIDISAWALVGKRNPDHQVRRNWPRQSQPTIHQLKLWNEYVKYHFIRYGTKWKTRLGLTRPNTWGEFKKFQTRTTDHTKRAPILHRTLKTYLKSLPKWYHRLLAHYKQTASDKIIWRRFRSRGKPIEIISDGGLAATIGTFGWKMVSSIDNISLSEGSGPIDGPMEVGSSTRSELGGFTAPLLLATALARFGVSVTDAISGGSPIVKRPLAK